MDDREFRVAVGVLLSAVLVAGLDAALKTFDTPPTFFPFLGVFSGAALGYRAVKRRKRDEDE